MKGHCKECDKDVSNIYSHRRSKKHLKNCPQDIIVKRDKLTEEEKKERKKASLKKYYEQNKNKKTFCDLCKKYVNDNYLKKHNSIKDHQLNNLLSAAILS